MQLKDLIDANGAEKTWSLRAKVVGTLVGAATLTAFLWGPLVQVTNLATQDDVRQAKRQAFSSDSAIVERLKRQLNDIRDDVEDNAETDETILKMIQCLYRKPSNISGVEFCGDVE